MQRDVIEGAKVVAIVRNGESVDSAAAGEDIEVITRPHPVLCRDGRPAGDAGELSAEGVALTVSDTKTTTAYMPTSPTSPRVR